MKKKLIVLSLLLVTTMMLSACGIQENQDGIFYIIFIKPMAVAIHTLAGVLNGSYGLAIISLTLIIRLVLMPLMLKQYKNQQQMKDKMEKLKPEMDEIQKKLKSTKETKEQQALQQEMMQLYKKHGVNPLSMGCLPVLIQMPILMGLYYAISSSSEIASHTFLWFNLGQPDITMTIAAGVIYFLQFKASTINMTSDQLKQMKFMGLISPLMIVFISFSAPAALPLYWSFGGLFLIIQTWIGKKLYTDKKKPILEKNNDD